MEDEIISILGKNHTDTIQFMPPKSYTDIYGLYTWKGKVYVSSAGMDIKFSTLEWVDQEKVLKLVKSKEWVVNPELQ